MRITVIALGRWKPGPLRELFESYRERLTLPFELRELEVKRKLPAGQLKEKEGELILASLPKGAKVVALDERGKALSSEGLAAKLGQWRDDGDQELCFIIGGAEGLSEAVRKRADLILQFGALTWPHLLVRVLLAEQIFRIQSIWAGHPYHRG